MDLLEPVVQPYAWGSHVAIAELQGRPTPSPGPEAELWFGAHPAGPSGLRREHGPTTLDAVIAADPVRELGTDCVARFGPRLPFLLKILAAARALSIQVHPDRARAEAGFRAENERGLRPDDPTRSYVDDWPKPEVVSALTPFEALAGLRDPADAAALLDGLDLAELAPILTHLGEGGPRAALAAVLRWPVGEQPPLLARVIAACTRVAAAGGPYAPACAAAVRIAADHPGDVGVLASLLLNHLVLDPGEALFMPAGGLHAYLNGVGVELLANSDNVIRAGITSKHVDVTELLRLVDPAVGVPRLSAQPLGPTTGVYDAPVPEFRLYRLELGAEPVPLPGAGPRLVLCVEGDAVLTDAAGAALKLRRGNGCFVAASDGMVRASGPAVVFAATVG